MYKSVLLTLVFLLSACAIVGHQADAPLTDKVWNNRFHNKRLAENVFDLEVIRFTDARHPAGRVPKTSPRIIYEYEPDRLLNGVKYRIPVLLEKNFDLTNVPEPIYKVEVELLKLRTLVATGGLLEGKHGKYVVELETHITVREPDSSVMFAETFDIELSERRFAGNARSPSAEYDQQELFALTEAAIRQVAQKVAWKTRRTHAKYAKAVRAGQ